MSPVLLRRELRLCLGRRPGVVVLAWAGGSLALGLLALAAGRLVAGEAADPRATLRVALLLRSAMVILAAPVLALAAVAAERAAGLAVLHLGRWRTATLLLAEFVLPALGVVSTIVLSGMPSWLRAWQTGAFPAGSWLRAELVLLAAALAALALGLLAALLFVETSTAAGIAVLAVALAGAAPLLCGPLVAAMPEAGAVIQASLAASPLVGVASALEFDILRTETLYRWSPLGQRRFTYPSPGSYVLSGLGLSLLAFGASVVRFAADRRGWTG